MNWHRGNGTQRLNTLQYSDTSCYTCIGRVQVITQVGNTEGRVEDKESNMLVLSCIH